MDQDVIYDRYISIRHLREKTRNFKFNLTSGSYLLNYKWFVLDL